jgi:hypothetical protein
VLYVDYQWDLDPKRILLDEEINVDRLGWKGGDLFKLVNENGRVMLVKVDPVVAFSQGHAVNVKE